VITYYDRRISLLYLVKVSYIYIIYIFLKNMHSRSYSKQPSICNQLKILFHFTTFLSFLKQPCTFTMHRHQRDHFVHYCKCPKRRTTFITALYSRVFLYTNLPQTLEACHIYDTPVQRHYNF